MKNILGQIYQNRYFLLFILLFAYVQSIYTRISIRQEINAYTFTPEAALFIGINAGFLFIIILFLINKWHVKNTFDRSVLLKIFAISLLIFLILTKSIGFLIALIFGNVERNFNPHTLTLSLFSDFLDGFIYGSFFIAYYYYIQSKKNQQKLAVYNEALAESKINTLKTQLNPHFLFNNLNILDQFIEEDKEKASDFLNEFADIYRYVLFVSDKKVVSIDTELAFAKQYFKLIQYKYENAYQLHITSEKKTGFIVPLALQLVLENAVQHNVGTPQYSIYITIDIDNKIVINNNIKHKKHIKETSGRAIENLKAQYKLLSNEEIVINQDKQQFEISIPIIHSIP